jgi:hypothetical protein
MIQSTNFCLLYYFIQLLITLKLFSIYNIYKMTNLMTTFSGLCAPTQINILLGAYKIGSRLLHKKPNDDMHDKISDIVLYMIFTLVVSWVMEYFCTRNQKNIAWLILVLPVVLSVFLLLGSSGNVMPLTVQGYDSQGIVKMFK